MEKKGVIAASEPKWISVTERLPEQSRNVLVCVKDAAPAECVVVDFLDADGTWSWTSPDEVTHWMELPKPPEGV